MAAAGGSAAGRLGLGRVLAALTTGSLGAGGATAYYYRPHPDETGVGLAPRPPLSSPRQLVDQADAEEPYLMQLARFVTIAFIAGVSRTYLLTLNDLRVKEDDCYRRLIDQVQHRDPGTALITVSNHVCTLDDPTLFAAMLPWSVNLRPALVRWSVCSQEICFKNDAVAAFFGAGKVMPIQRGGGIDQKLLQDLARRVAAGDWVHIFPEGKVSQTGKLEGRDLDKARALGGDRFKWGVGKLIARAPQRPIVVPVYHTGMQNFLPIIHAERRLRSWFPQHNQPFGAVVGEPIDFDDLFTEHRRRLLAQGLARPRADEDTPAHLTVAAEGWATHARERAVREEELRLYRAITRRIEGALKALEAKANAHHREVHGTEPPTFVDPDAEAEVRAAEARDLQLARRQQQQWWWRRLLPPSASSSSPSPPSSSWR